MRKLFAFLFAIVFFAACKSKSGDNKTGVVTHDTTRVLACYIDFQKKEVFNGPVWVIVRDTYVFKQVDSFTIKRTWGKDSMVFTPRLVKDSTGKEVLNGVPAAFETVSFERNFDTAVAHLQRWIKTHPQFFKVDSTTKQK